MKEHKRNPEMPCCTPETLAAFQKKLQEILPGKATNSEIATVIIQDDWFLGQVAIRSAQRLCRTGSSRTEFAELINETIRLIGERCQRLRAHGLDLTQIKSVSGFWRTVIDHATYDAFEHLRGPSRLELTMDVPAPERPNAIERQQEVREAIRQLPNLRQQEILTLRLDREMTFREIAGQLGLGERTVRRSYQEALQQLRRMLLD